MSGRRMTRMCGVAVLWLAGTAALAQPPPDTYAEQDFSRVDKIDTHVHLYGELPMFLARAKADAFRVLTINVNYADFPPLPEQLASAIAFGAQIPGASRLPPPSMRKAAIVPNGWRIRGSSSMRRWPPAPWR